MERTLKILKGGRKRKLCHEDCCLLDELYQQLVLYTLNFTAEDTNEHGNMLLESVQYLEEIIQNKKPLNEANIVNNVFAPVRRKDNEHVPKLGNIATEIQDGKIIYLMDGQPIKFQNMNDSTVYHHRWEDSFQQLKEFYIKHGHTNVTRSIPGYEDLGNWVTEQRRKLKRGKISQNQFEKLNEIGFEWNRSHYFFRTYRKKPEDARQQALKVQQACSWWLRK